MVRFLASAFKKSKDWSSFMCADYGDTDGIPPIKSARFWAAMIIGGDYLYKRIPFMFEYFDAKDHSELQLGKDDGTIEQLQKTPEAFRIRLFNDGDRLPWLPSAMEQACFTGVLRRSGLAPTTCALDGRAASRVRESSN